LERQRTLLSFLLCGLVGVGLTWAMLRAGELLLEAYWPTQATAGHVLPYLLVALNGLVVGVVLTWLSSLRIDLDLRGLRLRVEGFSRESYFPALDGFLASALVVVLLLERDGWQVSLDSVVEMLLRFEAHYGMLCFIAFGVFLARGVGCTTRPSWGCATCASR